MNCPKCQKNLPDGTVLCSRCGTHIVPQAAKREQAIPGFPRSPHRPGERRSVEFAPGVFMDFRWCPETVSAEWAALSGGSDCFMMGSPANERERRPNETLHPVRLSRGFWIGQTPVTNAQWRAIHPEFAKNDDRPVDRLSWNDANGFAETLSKNTGLAFSLPTEAQWEYACRAGKSTPFAGTGRYRDMASVLGNLEGFLVTMLMVIPYFAILGVIYLVAICRKKPVGKYRVNDWNLSDMHGNVAEWCLDWESAYPVTEDTDPRGPASGVRKIARGRGFMAVAGTCRSAARHSFAPGKRGAGFRLVLAEEEGGGRTDRASGERDDETTNLRNDQKEGRGAEG